MSQILTLKPDKEHLLESRHPWIFSGALKEIPADIKHGSIVKVANSKGAIVATGTFSNSSNIAVRVFSFADTNINADWFWQKIEGCDKRRTIMGFGPDFDTTGYRIVFGEADGIPGLVVDRYGDTLVVQLATAGIDKLMSLVVAALNEIFKPRAIFERSDIANRKEEQIGERTGTLYGDFSAGESVEFIEHGVKMLAHPLSGQKTGFYLDQKETRQIVRRLSKDKTVLNLFSYTGAGGISALMGGAYSVMNIDSSKWALSQCQLHATLNDLNTVKMATKETDVFQWLNNNRDEKFDMVIMDPPAIIKSQSGIDEGRKAYHFINRAAMRLLRKGGLFITSSCSQFLTVDDFATTLRRASVQNGLTLNVLKMISQAPDHPISVYFPESNYLKTFVCIVS